MGSSTTYTNGQKGKRSTRLRRLSILVILLTLFISADVFGIGSNIRFYSKWIECGQKPVMAANTYKGASYYTEAPVISLFRGPLPFFCTPLEAELARYSASPGKYEYPQIDKAYPDREQTGAPMQDWTVTVKNNHTAMSQMRLSAAILLISGSIVAGILYYKSRRTKG